MPRAMRTSCLLYTSERNQDLLEEPREIHIPSRLLRPIRRALVKREVKIIHMYHAAGEQLLQEPCEAGFAAAAAAVDRNDSGSAALRQPLYRQKGGEVARVGGAKQAVMRPVGGAERLAVAGRRAALSAVGCHPARHAGDRQGGEGVQPPRQPGCV